VSYDMSALSISSSRFASASLWPQVSAGNVANIADTGPPPKADASSTAAAPSGARVERLAATGSAAAATIAPFSPSDLSRYDSTAPAADKNAPAAAPNVDLASVAVQQIAASNASAADAKAIQAGSSAIRGILDIKV
jgi:flagellar basal body rod protein FlgC